MFAKSSIFIALMTVLAFTAQAFADVIPWPVTQHDLLRTGFTDIHGPSDASRVLTFPMGGPSSNGSAVGSDGTVYAGSWDGNVYAIGADFSTADWTFQTGGQIRRGPALGSDGTVYVGSRSGYFF